MAGLNRNLEDALKKIQQLSDKLEKITKKSAPSFDIKNIKDADTAINSLETSIDSAYKKSQELEDGFGGVASAIGAALDEMSKADSAVNRTIKSMRGISSITQDLKNDQAGLVSLSLKELKSKQDKLKSLSAEAKEQASIISKRYKRLDLDKNDNKLVGAALQTRLRSQGISQKEYQSIKSIMAANEENLQILDEAEEKLNGRIAQESKIQKDLGITGGILKGISKIPILGDVFDANEATEEMETHLRNGGSRVGALGKGFKNIGSQFKAGILNPANLMLGVWGLLIKAVLQSDKIIGDIAKGMNQTYSEAANTKQQLTDIANSSGDLLVTSKGVAESYMAINKTLGTNVMLNDKDLTTFTKLREVAGFTNEELMGIQKLSLSTGKSLEDNTKEFMAQAKITSVKNGVLLNEKELTKEISNLSAATTLSLSKNPKELAKAVATAKSLGMEMAQLEAISGNLLDFESSIQNELEAELLLGKDINLEKARQAALNNDLTTLGEELNKQLGTSADFAKMNRIQQDSLAKSMGMNREELAKTLYVQDQLKGASGEQAEEQRKLLDARIEQVGLAQAQSEMEDKGFEGLQKQASMQERMAGAMEKLQEILVTVADALMPIFDIFVSIFDIIGPIIKLLSDTLTPVLKGIKAILTPIVDALKWVFSGGESDFSATTAAWDDLSKSATASVMGVKGNDIISPSTGGGGGYGKRTLMGPEGAIQLNNKDTVIAGTNLFGDDVKSEPGKPTQTSSAGAIQTGGGRVDMTQTNALLQQLINAVTTGGVVMLDGQKVGQALNLGSYKTQ